MVKGLIIIQHGIIRTITREECIAALPDEWKSLDRIAIEVKPISLDQANLYDAPFEQIALEQRVFFTKDIAPILEKYPDYKILYFGLAPIPLAIDLGYQFRNYRDLSAFQYHHTEKKWYQTIEKKPRKGFEFVSENIPEQKQKGIDQLLVRLSISHPIRSDDTMELLPEAAEVDLRLANPNEDAITSIEEMNEIVEGVKDSFDSISHNESKLEVIHLFAAIPCGVSFLVGTKISPTIHPLIQTYQYSSTHKPFYRKALLIKGEFNDERTLSEEEIAEANHIRVICNDELTKNIRAFIPKNKSASVGRSWAFGATTEDLGKIMSDKFWDDLPAIHTTSLGQDEFDFEKKAINDGFYWDDSKWYVDDHFMLAVKRRLKEDEKIKKAIRLFLFHEALHYSRHKLTETRAVNIGSFPKVIESADYQADVYALVNEYGYAVQNGVDVSSPKNFFLEAIEVATETMWSFDDNGKPLRSIQIRRLNRYLIWYWQYVRIKKDGNTLIDILKILQEKPVIEINGLKTHELNNRFFYDLEERTNYLEIAMFSNNELKRGGSASNMPVENLIDGVKNMRAEFIIGVLKSFLES